MRRKRLCEDPCPIARSLDVIGDWWSLLIVREALHGTCRFSDFQQRLGLARNILSARLRKLVEQGVLETRPSAERSDHNEYHLTAKGRGLEPVLRALYAWGKENLFAAETASAA
ncbi:winged helix-turn-helix transcriptional regulator [Bordetella flabilis]|uniref:HxlR family transcriptional regulator n=1 Tax=Bordetella flabilis TaxID=463014 RepID=A0A193GGP5_9BORD|nr:helix-turn-helix domain-containing protein [Bordetella flabilis]ANN79227.1 HxlR family transcriptional regulator [Bordetella flabilis]